MRYCLTLLAATFVMCVSAGTAQAQGCQTAPGTAAVDQYCESAPSADGGGGSGGAGDSRSSGDAQNAVGDSSDGTGAATVSPSTSQQLQRAGASGQALDEVLGGGSSKTGKNTGATRDKRHAASGQSAGKGTASTPDVPSSNPLTAVTAAATDGAVLGGPLVWVLLAAAIAALGLGLLRARSGTSSKR